LITFANSKLRTFCTIPIFFNRYYRFLLTPLFLYIILFNMEFLPWTSASTDLFFFEFCCMICRYDGEMKCNNNTHEAFGINKRFRHYVLSQWRIHSCSFFHSYYCLLAWQISFSVKFLSVKWYFDFDKLLFQSCFLRFQIRHSRLCRYLNQTCYNDKVYYSIK